MTAAEIAKVYMAKEEARRQQALIDSVYTPELKEAVASYMKTAMPKVEITEQWKKHVAEIIANQPKMEIPRHEIPHSLLEQMSKQIQLQNQDLLRIARKHATLFGGIKFQLPEGYLEAVAAWRERLGEEAAAEDPRAGAGLLRRLAEEREAIIKCLYRIGLGFEGFAYLPISPVSPIIGYLFMLAAMFGEVADEYILEREDGDD